MLYTDLAKLTKHEIFPGFLGRFVHSASMTFAYWDIEADAEVPLHQHHNEQVVNMLKGEFELSVDGRTQILKQGDVVVIPPNTDHGGRAVTDCRILDVFCPVREPYIL
ncbi:MAG: cupin domain-containing protein [Saprospiraceae bacterium]|nr:cupin domain-containing protein [Saprospiraceae bacterium]